VAADKRVTRALYAVFVAGSAAFIVSSVWQIASAVFLPETTGNPRVGQACAAAIAELEHGVDRGVAAAVSNTNPDEAERLYQSSRGDAWQKKDDLLRPCETEPVGPEAVAALARFDRAAASSLRRHVTELGPVRREVESFIR
jgi:hypothetical protein